MVHVLLSSRCWLLWTSTVTRSVHRSISSNAFLSSNAKDKVHRTIEDELVEALVKVGAIQQEHADDMSKVGIIKEGMR